ncbi:hypothetical protein [Phenylobacterium sp.]|uniref:hypothetical protein n=1 Tax=Phenylobacterium sp. TaxID=1871053 RepID=UPI003BAC3852
MGRVEGLPRARAVPLDRRRRAAAERARGAGLRLPDRAADILSSIVNVSSPGVVVTGADMRALLFSKGTEEVFRHPACEVVGRSLAFGDRRRDRHFNRSRRLSVGL